MNGRQEDGKMEEWRGILCPNKKLSLTTGCDSCDCFSKSITLTVLCCCHAVSLYVVKYMSNKSIITGVGAQYSEALHS